MRRHRHAGIERVQMRGGGLHFGPAHIGGGKKNLPLQIGKAHPVVIDQAQMADPSGGQIERHGAAQPARAHDQDFGFSDFRLADAAHFPKHDVAGIAFQFFVIQRHACHVMLRQAGEQPPFMVTRPAFLLVILFWRRLG